MNDITKHAIIIAVALLHSLPWPQASLAGNSDSPGYWPTHSWQVTSPEEQGMDSGKLADMIQAIRDQALNLHSITIVRNGYIVTDSCFFPFPEDSKHNLRSGSKSVMSILIGIAINEGYIRSGFHNLLQGIMRIFSSSAYFEIGFLVDRQSETAPDDWMVVNNKDFNFVLLLVGSMVLWFGHCRSTLLKTYD